jgi:hypothetical protein
MARAVRHASHPLALVWTVVDKTVNLVDQVPFGSGDFGPA